MNDNLILESLQRIEKALARPRQEWFSIDETAALTGLSYDHVRRAVLAGELPASDMGTPDRALHRICYADIEAWLEKRKAGAFVRPKRTSTELPFSQHR